MVLKGKDKIYMKESNKNLIFLIFILIFILFIFATNFVLLHNETLKESKYEIYHEEFRDLIFAKIKLSKKYKFDGLTMGTSTTYSLFDSKKCKMARIIVFGMTYREFYEYLKGFYAIHNEPTAMFLPIEYHSFLDENDTGKVPHFDGKSTLSPSEFVNVYFSVNSTKMNFRNLFEKLEYFADNQKFSTDDDENVSEPLSEEVLNEKFIETYTKRRLKTSDISDERRKNDLYYWGKIIDFLQEKNVKIYCFVPPYNYIYLQEAMTPKNEKIINDVKALIVSKGVEIYDFTKMNKYNTEPLPDSFLYSDLIHPYYVYGNIVFEALTTEKGDKNLYRLITKNNIKSCVEASHNELAQYRSKYKNYIEEYDKYDISSMSESYNYCVRKTLSKMPKELQKYL